MEKIGKYTIVGRIGVGGFGVVYEGLDPFLKRRVAIKTCTSDARELRDRFFREAEIAGNLQHRNIVTVHDFGVQDDIPYLVQEFLSGEDLDRKIRRREHLSGETKLDILLQAARGLEYAHSKNVIHRDIKPGNLRVTANGTVKIMDFGIAKLANVASHLTRTGMTLGTAAYLPPEQIRGATVDHRADIFSFGVSAYELTIYRRPFGGKTISSLFFEIINQQPAAPTSLWPRCPADLEAVILRCLAKNPDERYDSFAPIIAGLSRVLETTRQQARQVGDHTTNVLSQRQLARDAAAPKLDAVEQLLAAGEVEAADKSLQQILRQDPEDSRARELAVAVDRARQARRLEAVRSEVAAAVARDDLPAARRALAVAGSAGVATEALAPLSEEIDRADSDQLLARAAAERDSGNFDAALATVSRLSQRHPGEAAVDRLRQEILSRRRSVAPRPPSPTSNATSHASPTPQAIAGMLARGDLDAAESALDQLAKGGGGSAVAALRQQLRRQRRTDLETEVAQHVTRARQCLDRGDLAAAITATEHALALAPDDPAAGALLREAQTRLQAPEGNLDATVGRIEALLASGKTAAAERQLQEAEGSLGPVPELARLRKRVLKLRNERPPSQVGPLPPGAVAARERRRSDSLSASPHPTGEGRSPATATRSGPAPGARNAAFLRPANPALLSEAPIPWRLLALVAASLLGLVVVAILRFTVFVPATRQQVPEPQAAPRSVATGEAVTSDDTPTTLSEGSQQSTTSNTPTQAAPPPPPQTPLYLWNQDGVENAELESMPTPEVYAPEGGPTFVLLYVLVDSHGGVANIQTLEGSNDPRLVSAARQVAQAAHFRPATKDSVPGRQWTTLKVRFATP